MKRQSIEELLKSIELFQHLDDSCIKLMLEQGSMIQFHHGDIILSQGKPGPGLFVLTRGQVLVTMKLVGKGEIELASLSPGQFFGEFNLLENAPCTATVKSIGKSNCFLLSKTVYNMLLVAYPHIRFLISQAITQQVLVRQANMRDEIRRHYNYPANIGTSITANTKQERKKILLLSPTEKINALSYLDKFPLFEAFNIEELHSLIRLSNIIKVSQQFKLLKQDELQQACYFILEGAVQITARENYEGKFAVFGPNRFIGHTSLIDKKPELFACETCGLATLLEIPYPQLVKMMNHHLQVWYKLHDIVCVYIVGLQKNLNTQILRIRCENSK